MSIVNDIKDTCMTQQTTQADDIGRSLFDVTFHTCIVEYRILINPLRSEVYFCHQNQNAKNIGNLMTLLKPHNIGTHLKGIETSFQVKSFHFWASYITF
jgi:hypothetical protein